MVAEQKLIRRDKSNLTKRYTEEEVVGSYDRTQPKGIQYTKEDPKSTFHAFMLLAMAETVEI